MITNVVDINKVQFSYTYKKWDRYRRCPKCNKILLNNGITCLCKGIVQDKKSCGYCHLCASIEAIGMSDPVVTTPSLKIIRGDHRLAVKKFFLQDSTIRITIFENNNEEKQRFVEQTNIPFDFDTYMLNAKQWLLEGKTYKEIAEIFRSLGGRYSRYLDDDYDIVDSLQVFDFICQNAPFMRGKIDLEPWYSEGCLITKNIMRDEIIKSTESFPQIRKETLQELRNIVKSRVATRTKQKKIREVRDELKIKVYYAKQRILTDAQIQLQTKSDMRGKGSSRIGIPVPYAKREKYITIRNFVNSVNPSFEWGLDLFAEGVEHVIEGTGEVIPSTSKILYNYFKKRGKESGLTCVGLDELFLKELRKYAKGARVRRKNVYLYLPNIKKDVRKGVIIVDPTTIQDVSPNLILHLKRKCPNATIIAVMMMIPRSEIYLPRWSVVTLGKMLDSRKKYVSGWKPFLEKQKEIKHIRLLCEITTTRSPCKIWIVD